MATSAEIVAKPIAYKALSKVGVKKSYFFTFTIALVGTLMILFTDGRYESKLLMGVCLFLTKLGLAATFIVNYLSLEKVFPTLFCATAAGICNFFGRLATIFSPMIAEISPPLPNMILFGFLIIAVSAATLYEVPT